MQIKGLSKGPIREGGEKFCDYTMDGGGHLTGVLNEITKQVNLERRCGRNMGNWGQRKTLLNFTY